MVPYWISRSAVEFYELLVREQVTVLNQTPSAFYELMRADAVNRQDLALKFVIFGGEALDLFTLKPWFERHGDQQPALINMYGITETTVHVTYGVYCGKCSRDPVVELVAFWVISGCMWWMKDEAGAGGSGGELYIGGAGLARGYLNRAD